jgi:tetratricopeptide (TPR) repeat protein
MLTPVIGIIQVGSQAHADRYTYLPQIGLYLLATWATTDALASWPHRRRILGATAGVTIIALTWRAWIQTSYWRNSESLWLHTLAVTSENPVAHNSFALLLLGHDRADEAIDQFQMAVNIDPGFAEAQNNLSVALTKKGRTEEAIAHLQTVLKWYPGEAKAHYNLGNALLQKGELNAAIAAYERALSIQPRYADARYNLGIALEQNGRVDEAIAQYQKTLQDKPDYAEAYYMLGNNLLEKRRIDEAIASYQQALRIRADYPQVQNNLGLALIQEGRASEAIAHWEKTLEIRSDFVDTLNNLAWVLATYPEGSIRNGPEAVALAERAHQISGNKNPAIFRTLAAAYAESGRFADAMDIAQRGLQLAKTQGNYSLADIFEGDIALYRANAPVRTAGRP